MKSPVMLTGQILGDAEKLCSASGNSAGQGGRCGSKKSQKVSCTLVIYFRKSVERETASMLLSRSDS